MRKRWILNSPVLKPFLTSWGLPVAPERSDCTSCQPVRGMQRDRQRVKHQLDHIDKQKARLQRHMEVTMYRVSAPGRSEAAPAILTSLKPPNQKRTVPSWEKQGFSIGRKSTNQEKARAKTQSLHCPAHGCSQ